MANTSTTMTVNETAALLGIRPQTLRILLEKGSVPWGVCIPTKRKRYIIYRQRFETETGIKTKGEPE